MARGKKTDIDDDPSIEGSSKKKGLFGAPKDPAKAIPRTLSPSGSAETYYLSSEALKRPLDLPRSIKFRSLIFVIIALLIGAVFFSFYYDKVLNAPLHEQEALQANLDRKVSLDLPDLKELVSLDDAAIMSELSRSGSTLFERVPAGSGTSFEVIKLPEGVTLADAGALYLRGINNLSASEAVLLLNGSWDLNVNRENGINMSIHYANFNLKTSEAVMQEAMVAEGFTADENNDSGTDSAGNTYSTGTIEIDGTSYTWRVSALPLSEVYSMSGIPSDAYYVGIRISG